METSPDGEFHDGVDLVPIEPAVGESLQMNDQDLGQIPQVELLGGRLVLLTLWTVPGGMKHNYSGNDGIQW